MSSSVTTASSSSRTRHHNSTRSPVNKVPYDVLMEIFIHCLPRYPLEVRQPNTIIAPMLLCKVCSTWRIVALTSPTLWSHLSFAVTLYYDNEERSFVFLQREIDFILWWKKNQGSMAPFLRFDGSCDDDVAVPHWCIAAGDGMSFFVNYLKSAQFLQINPLMELVLEKTTEFGHQLVCPDLHTVVTCPVPDADRPANPFYYMPSYTPLLRYLSIRDSFGPKSDTVPKHWSTLTHLSLFNVALPLGFWLPLIRALPALQWAHIDFHTLYDIEGHITPAEYVHRQLSTLFVAYKWSQDTLDVTVCPLHLLFTGLHLPVLHTLSLYSDSSVAISFDVDTVLQATPKIKSLAIRGYNFLAQYNAEHFQNILEQLEDVEPLWNPVPCLTHLQLSLPYIHGTSNAKAAEILDNFVHDFFFSNFPWMDLCNSACPIRTITLIDEKKENPRFDVIRDRTMASIRKRIGGSSNIIFKVISEAESEGRIAEDAWKEWGSRI